MSFACLKPTIILRKGWFYTSNIMKNVDNIYNVSDLAHYSQANHYRGRGGGVLICNQYCPKS